MGYIWTSITDVTIHLPHHANMLVAVEQREFFILHCAAPTAVGSLVGLETCIG